MLTLIRDAIVGQYGAALAMLRGCLDRADSTTWEAAVGRVPFWHVAYHALFYTDLYLSRDEGAFRPPPFHRDGYNFFGPPPWAPDMRVVIERPFDKPTLAAYLDACRAKVRPALADETEATLAGPSGFDWLPITRLELHLYNIRHIQHHTGQLAALLRRQGNKGVAWVGSEPL